MDEGRRLMEKNRARPVPPTPSLSLPHQLLRTSRAPSTTPVLNTTCWRMGRREAKDHYSIGGPGKKCIKQHCQGAPRVQTPACRHEHPHWKGRGHQEEGTKPDSTTSPTIQGRKARQRRWVRRVSRCHLSRPTGAGGLGPSLYYRCRARGPAGWSARAQGSNCHGECAEAWHGE